MARSRLGIILIATILVSTLLVPTVSAADQGRTFTVIGLVYNDENLDGSYGLSANGVEAAIANIAVALYVDDAPYGSLGSEDKLLDSQMSNTDGYVAFHNVLPGNYLLTVKKPATYVATNPTTQGVLVGDDAMGTVIEWTFGLASRNQFRTQVYLPALQS